MNEVYVEIQRFIFHEKLLLTTKCWNHLNGLSSYQMNDVGNNRQENLLSKASKKRDFFAV